MTRRKGGNAVERKRRIVEDKRQPVMASPAAMRFLLSKDTCVKNEKSAVKGDPKKSGCGIAAEAGIEQGEIGLKISLTVFNLEKRGLTLVRIERKALVVRMVFQSNQCFSFGLRGGRYQGRKRT